MLPSIDGFADTDRSLAFFGMDRVAVFVADEQKKSRKSAEQPKKFSWELGVRLAFSHLSQPSAT